MNHTENALPRDFWTQVESAVGKKDAHHAERTIGAGAATKIYTLFQRHLAENGPIMQEYKPREATVLAIQAAVIEALQSLSPSMHTEEPNQFRTERGITMRNDKLRKIVERRTLKNIRRPKHITDRLEHIQNVGWIPTPDEL